MDKSISSFREDQLKAILRFIYKADQDEIASIISEIMVCHGLKVWDAHTKKLKDVQTIKLGYDEIRLIVDEEFKDGLVETTR